MKGGVCSCSGELERKTFRQAWAKRGIPVDRPLPPSADAECYQCSKCDMIYHVTMVEASDISLDQTQANRKDFGFAHGRA